MKLSSSSALLPGIAISTHVASSPHRQTVFLRNISDRKQGKAEAGGSAVAVELAATDTFSRSVSSILAKVAQSALQAQGKRLADMKEALERLRAMPSAKSMAKSAATERAIMLKKLLDMLKQMMIGATPAQAKAMAAQLKDIAKELAAMGKLLSGGGGASVAAPSSAVESEASASSSQEGAAASAFVAPSPSDTPTEAEVIPSEASDAPAQFHNARQALTAYATETKQNAQEGAGDKGAEKLVDDGLKKALQDALKSLRSLLSLLKSQIRASGKEEKEMNDAQRKVAELARSLTEADKQNNGAADMPEQIAAAETAIDTVTDSVGLAGGSGAEIAVDDAGGAMGRSVSVSA